MLDTDLEKEEQAGNVIKNHFSVELPKKKLKEKKWAAILSLKTVLKSKPVCSMRKE